MESPLKDIQIPTVLKTERLELRLSTLDMAKDVNAAVHASAAEFQPWFCWMNPELPSIEDTMKNLLDCSIDQKAKKAFHFGIYLKDTDTLVGRISLDKYEPNVPAFNIGYWTHSAHTGKGYMSEAVDVFLDFAIHTLKSARLEIFHDVENIASKAVIQKMVDNWGFKHIGLCENRLRSNFDGTLRHHEYYCFTQNVK